MTEGLQEKLRQVRLFAMDVDGVLTDGQIQLTSSGDEIKSFSARDGIALKCLHRAGLKSALITARGSDAVKRRAKELGIGDVILNATDKRTDLLQLCASHNLEPAQVAFVGDDLQDLGALGVAGVSISVADCPTEVAERVDLVTRAAGGKGAIREAIEAVLKAQSVWDSVVASFLE